MLSTKITRYPSRRNPSRYWRTAQVAPPWSGTAAIIPLKRMMGEPLPGLSIRSGDKTRLLEQPAQDPIRIEIRLGDRAGGSGMLRVVACDPLGAGDGFLHRAEGHQALAHRVVAAEASVLHEYRSARGQVADRPVAEPAALRLDVDPLGDREFRTRGLNILTEGNRSGCHDPGIDDVPSVTAERNHVLLVGRIDVQRDFESLRHALREFDELPEFMGLQPVSVT